MNKTAQAIEFGESLVQGVMILYLTLFLLLIFLYAIDTVRRTYISKFSRLKDNDDNAVMVDNAIF